MILGTGPYLVTFSSCDFSEEAQCLITRLFCSLDQKEDGFRPNKWHGIDGGKTLHQQNQTLPGKEVSEAQPTLLPPDRPRINTEWDEGIPTRLRLRSRWVLVVNWAGPWRRTGQWWKDEANVEAYQMVTEAGGVLCEVEGKWRIL